MEFSIGSVIRLSTSVADAPGNQMVIFIQLKFTSGSFARGIWKYEMPPLLLPVRKPGWQEHGCSKIAEKDSFLFSNMDGSLILNCKMTFNN